MPILSIMPHIMNVDYFSVAVKRVSSFVLGAYTVLRSKLFIHKFVLIRGKETVIYKPWDLRHI